MKRYLPTPLGALVILAVAVLTGLSLWVTLQ